LRDDRRAAGGLIALVAIVLGWLLTGAMSPAPPAYGAGVAPRQVTGGQGAALYLQSCAACHGPGAGGDSVGGGFVAPPLLGQSPVIVGEAIRTGPGAMPVFGPGQISDEELDDVAAYLVYLHDDAAPGGATLGGSGPVVEGYVAWLVGMGLLVLAARQIERRKRR
jgi:ubiquinol-cytochrome c reductase cytochrome c subunit